MKAGTHLQSGRLNSTPGLVVFMSEVPHHVEVNASIDGGMLCIKRRAQPLRLYTQVSEEYSG